MSFEVRLHGHVRVDNRWVQFPEPIRRLYGQASDVSAAANSPLPQFSEYTAPNVACIFTTPPALVADGVVRSSARAAGSAAGSVEAAGPASAHASKVPRGAVEASGRTWRRDFAVRLPRAMLPTFRGLGARVLYMATLSARVRPGVGGGAGAALPDVHLPFSVLGSGRRGLSRSGPGAGGALHSVDLAHVSVGPAEGLGGVAHPAPGGTASGALPTLRLEPWDLLRRRRDDDDDGGGGNGGVGGGGSNPGACGPGEAPTVFTIRHGGAGEGAVRVVLHQRRVLPGGGLLVTLDFGDDGDRSQPPTAPGAAAVRGDAWAGDEGRAAARARAELNSCAQVPLPAGGVAIREWCPQGQRGSQDWPPFAAFSAHTSRTMLRQPSPPPLYLPHNSSCH